MSLILKGFDLPLDNVLRIEIHPNGTVWEEGREWIKHRQSAIQIPTPHGRLADLDKLNARMYHEAFETDTILQKWDGGCWIRYKLFEILRDTLPTILEGEYE